MSLSKEAVEKHVSAIFGKLGLVESGETSWRVKVALMYVAGGRG